MGTTDENLTKLIHWEKEEEVRAIILLDGVEKDDGSCTYDQEKFLGTYEVISLCFSDVDTYTVNVTQGPSKESIILNNFNGEGGNTKAIIKGSEFSFLGIYSGVGYVGTGYIVGSKITIDYFACEDYNCPEASCNIELIK